MTTQNVGNLPDDILSQYQEDLGEARIEWADENYIIIHFSETTYHVWVRRRGTWTLRR